MSGTVRRAILVSLGLIGLYLVLDKYTGFSKDTRATGQAGRGIIKSLQGR